MELSLHLSFYLRHSLRGYMVDTTTGFPIKIVEALAPLFQHQISRKCSLYHMITCSTDRRLTGSIHPLKGGLKGYYQATGYGPKHLDTTGSL
jgi:hypothetical protein